MKARRMSRIKRGMDSGGSRKPSQGISESGDGLKVWNRNNDFLIWVGPNEYAGGDRIYVSDRIRGEEKQFGKVSEVQKFLKDRRIRPAERTEVSLRLSSQLASWKERKRGYRAGEFGYDTDTRV